MEWIKEYIYQDVFEFANTNQHGERYKKSKTKRAQVAKLSCECSNTEDMRTLVILGDYLNVPVRYDFESKPQKAFIKVVSSESIENIRQQC